MDPRPTLKNGPTHIFCFPQKGKSVFISDSQLVHCSQILNLAVMLF